MLDPRSPVDARLFCVAVARPPQRASWPDYREAEARPRRTGRAESWKSMEKIGVREQNCSFGEFPSSFRCKKISGTRGDCCKWMEFLDSPRSRLLV
ncbi:hypothetical protein [Saccharopolyspora mangrovi]|uniref:Uncharacterized protein n=1 Tax=Saccharopolyspora mangrovi TaxID=3082379 RepID=A0ABU6A6U8_9PSEU|nr:hypothetical protein [Saccharopolyspora sp. S2-29]MEB3367270.1 hypothetical protein [Saccharopolyspora sp. S2-29]